MPKKVNISIIIVNYKVKKELLVCIDSIYKTSRGLKFEIIVVDNDEIKTLKDPLFKKYPEVIYIPSDKNVGWGSGINIGAKYAKGDYLYMLNPDTILTSGALKFVYDAAKNQKRLGVAASRLVDFQMKPYSPLGSKILTPLRGLAAYTFLEKLPLFSSIVKDFFAGDKKGDFTYLDVPPLTASLISTRLFKSIGGFDKNIFLYFEENDLGKRLSEKGLVSFIHDKSLVKHAVGASTKKSLDSNQFFKWSRKYYFRKHFGWITANTLELVFSL